MTLGPRLDLRQSQSLVMTPQLQQAIKLLALSNLEIETFLAEAVEANPLLEFGEAADAPDQTPDDPPRTTALETSGVDQLIAEGRSESDAPLDLDPAALDQDRDAGDARGDDRGADQAPSIADGLGMDGIRITGDPGGDDGSFADQRACEITLADHLHAQLGAIADGLPLLLARLLVDQLDETGYLAIALREFADDAGVSLLQAQTALDLVQSLDPTGVGARNLAECLALQAIEADRHDPCMARLLENLDLLALGKVAQLKRMCGVDDEDFADMLAELRSYDPKPGLRFGSSAAPPVVPDLFIIRDQQGWQVTINSATLPQLLVNRSYHAQLLAAGSSSKQAKSWVNEKLADANWLVRTLDQRQQTILKVASEIVKQQDGFFRHGVSRLRPLTLRQVAEAVEMHESTISRVTSAKYLQCDRGVFELKYFFTSGVQTHGSDGVDRDGAAGTAGPDGVPGGGGGGAGASAEAVKARIRSLIAGEDAKAILSDETITTLLNEEGIAIARRTVVKYREAIGLGSSVQRRRARAIA